MHSITYTLINILYSPAMNVTQNCMPIHVPKENKCSRRTPVLSISPFRISSEILDDRVTITKAKAIPKMFMHSLKVIFEILSFLFSFSSDLFFCRCRMFVSEDLQLDLVGFIAPKTCNNTRVLGSFSTLKAT